MNDYLYELTLSYADGDVNLKGSSKLPTEETITLIASTVAGFIKDGKAIERVWEEDLPVQAVFTAEVIDDDISLKIKPVEGDDTFDMYAIAVRAAQFCIDQRGTDDEVAS